MLIKVRERQRISLIVRQGHRHRPVDRYETGAAILYQSPGLLQGTFNSRKQGFSADGFL
jgi:hypothetical protein